MRRLQGLLLGCSFAVFFALPQIEAQAQNLKIKPIRIKALMENSKQGEITLFVDSTFPITAPRTEYLRTSDGANYMFVDFPGLSWPYPAKMLKILEGDSNIQTINIGQFQSSPPIFRLAIRSKTPDSLKNISFQTTDGRLTLSWRKNEEKIPEHIAIVPAPFVSKAITPSKIAVAPPVTKTRSSLVFTTENLPDISELDSNKSGSGSSITKEETNEMSSPEADNALPPPMTPIVHLENSPSPVLTVKTDRRLTYKTFRLHEPERFVVDFENLVSLETSAPPELSGNEFLKEVRLGARHDRNPSGRLVCDLTSDTIDVEPTLSDDGQSLAMRFYQGKAERAQPIPGGIRIVLDAGHGGKDAGAQRGTSQEKEITLAITQNLKRDLEERGFKVYLTRQDDNFVSLEDRVHITNTLMPDLFLSVHINSLVTDSDLHGIETYYQTATSRMLADCVHESLVNHLDAPDRSVRKARFYVINHTPVPAILAEVGFISSKDEREKLISSDYQHRVAKALEQGVILYLAKQNELAQVDHLHVGLAKKQLESFSLNGEDRHIADSKAVWQATK
jgi:N-acetylmuramoyl-L-alanine amidase